MAQEQPKWLGREIPRTPFGRFLPKIQICSTRAAVVKSQFITAIKIFSKNISESFEFHLE